MKTMLKKSNSSNSKSWYKRRDIYMILLLTLILGASGAFSISSLKEATKMQSEPHGVEVTIYNNNLGVVKEVRSVELEAGTNDILYDNVASLIDPTSVRLTSLSGALSVLEQNYEYDLVSRDKIMQKYIGKEITAYQVIGDNLELVEGELLSFSGNQVVLKDKDGSLLIANVDNLELPELPDGLISTPTLHWLVQTTEGQEHDLELSYMTSGLNWNANYVAVVDNSDSNIDLNAWVTLTNNAGTTFNDAKLKLIAGEVNRVQSVPTPRYEKAYMAMDMAETINGGYFDEESLFEYHLYDLERTTTLKDKEQKQIALLESSGISAEKEYIFRSNNGPSAGKVSVNLKFENSEKNDLGIPLPAGTIRVFKADSDGQLQFIGEDSIDHTPKDEEIELNLGNAFDITAEKTQTDYTRLGDSGAEYEYEIIIKNHKDENVVVSVVEGVSGDWEIKSENFDHEKKSQNEIRWDVPVKADGETTLKFKIRFKY